MTKLQPTIQALPEIEDLWEPFLTAAQESEMERLILFGRYRDASRADLREFRRIRIPRWRKEVREG